MVSFLKKLSSKSTQGSQVFPYFFDDEHPDPNAPKFWTTAQIAIDNQKMNLITGFSLHTKSKKKSGDIKPLFICLYKHYLLAAKSKDKINKQHKSVDLSKNFLTMQKITPSSNKYTAGLSLAYNQKQIEIFSKNKEDINTFFYQLRKYTIQTNFEEMYTLEKKLGAGSYASVYRIKDKATRKDFAAKFFDIASFKDPKRSKLALKNEINIHRQLEHGNICKLLEVFDSPTHLIIVMEYGRGQRLLDYVVANSPLPEREALTIIKELMEAVAYIHNLGILHRDIKLENVVFEKDSESDGMSIKLIDFGLSVTTDNIDLFKKSGTPGYVAPEILVADTYGTQVDVFSLGVILYTMLSGRSPFVGPDRETVLRLNKKCEFAFKPRHWNHINAHIKDLVKRMMEADPDKRITVQNALVHRSFSLISLQTVQSLKVLPREITITLTPQQSPKEKVDKPEKMSEKSKTLSVDHNNSFVVSRSINIASKASLFKEKRSESSKPIESLLTASQVSIQNPNLLQIPHTNIVLAPSEGEEEKGIRDVPSDGINKGSLRTFYKLNSDYGTEDPNSPWVRSQERLSPLFPNKNALGIFLESPRLKDKTDSLKETDRLGKSLTVSVSVSVANSRSLDPSSVPGSMNESEMAKKQSCELSFELEEDTMIMMPRIPKPFKASMMHIKKTTGSKNKSKKRKSVKRITENA